MRYHSVLTTTNKNPIHSLEASQTCTLCVSRSVAAGVLPSLDVTTSTYYSPTPFFFSFFYYCYYLIEELLVSRKLSAMLIIKIQLGWDSWAWLARKGNGNRSSGQLRYSTYQMLQLGEYQDFFSFSVFQFFFFSRLVAAAEYFITVEGARIWKGGRGWGAVLIGFLYYIFLFFFFSCT